MRIERMSGIEDISDALSLRDRIFIQEQGVPSGREVDGLDDSAEHYVGYFIGEAIAVARVQYLTVKTARLERVGVLEPMRGEGAGTELMNKVLADLKTEGVRRVELDSPARARKFYASLGFEPVGEPFIEEDTGIEHIRMEKELFWINPAFVD